MTCSIVSLLYQESEFSIFAHLFSDVTHETGFSHKMVKLCFSFLHKTSAPSDFYSTSGICHPNLLIVMICHSSSAAAPRSEPWKFKITASIFTSQLIEIWQHHFYGSLNFVQSLLYLESINIRTSFGFSHNTVIKCVE